jgi:hypothetical protein
MTEKFKYSITMLKYPKGHGFRVHHSTTKKGAEELADHIGGSYRIRKLKKYHFG